MLDMPLIESWDLVSTEDEVLERKVISREMRERVEECLKRAGVDLCPSSADVGKRYRAFATGQMVLFDRDDKSVTGDAHGKVFRRSNEALMKDRVRALFERKGLSMHEMSPGLFLAYPAEFLTALSQEEAVKAESQAEDIGASQQLRPPLNQ